MRSHARSIRSLAIIAFASLALSGQLLSASPIRAVASSELLPLGAAPATAQRGQSAGTSGGAISSGFLDVASIWPLFVVIGIIVCAAIIVRKLAKGDPGLASALGAGGKAPSGVLEVLGRYPVARGQNLVLLRIDRRVLLLSHTYGKSGAGFSTLTEMTDPQEVASIVMKVNEVGGKSMKNMLNEAMASMERGADRAESESPGAQPFTAGVTGPSGLRTRLAGMINQATSLTAATPAAASVSASAARTVGAQS